MINRISLPAVCWALGVLTPVSAFAETPYSEEVMTSAHRLPIPAYRLGASVSDLSEQQIEARGQLNVADLMRSMPGIAVSNNGGAGKSTSLRIRGEEDYRTVVYLDGVKMSDPSATQVSPRLQHMLTCGLERIEVLRGPQGMMYGADAGGVVNLYSKSPEAGFASDLSAETGRYGTTEFCGNARGISGPVSYSLSAADFSTDGYNTRSDDVIVADDDGYENTTFHGDVSVQLAEGMSLRAVGRHVEGENEYDSGATSTDREDEFDQNFGRLAFNMDRGQFTNRLGVARNRVVRHYYQDGELSSSTPKYLSLLDQANYLGSYRLDSGDYLIYGADYEQQRDELNETEQDQVGAYVEWQGHLGENFYYSTGVRHDDNDVFGEHTSVRLTAAHITDLKNGDRLKLKSSYGTGFRAPSLYEQWYNTRSGYAFGEAAETELAEEKSQGVDAGIVYIMNDRHQFEVVLFWQEIEDEISFDVEGFSGYLQYEGTSQSRGVELNMETALTDNLQVYANATFNETETSEGEQRPRRPREYFNVGAEWFVWDRQLRINGNLRGSYDSIDNSGVALDDYETMDATVTWFYSPAIEFYARAENLFDANYVEITNYNTSGAAFYAGARFSF